MVNINAVDIFCGAGGLTYGLNKAGVNVQLGVDIDPACEYPFAKTIVDTNKKPNTIFFFMLSSSNKFDYEVL